MPPRKLKPVQAPPPIAAPPDLRVSVQTALADMAWLQASDEALRTLALRLAGEIELAVERAELFGDVREEFGGDPSMYKRLQRLEAMCDVTKTVGWLGPQLQGVLRDLGGTPAARKAMQADKPIGGRLAQIRRDAGQDDS